jgi:DNA replication protein DnaC
LKGLETLIECETTQQTFETDPREIFVGDLSSLKEFLDKPRVELDRNVAFVHGSSGNGTTFLLNSIAKYFSTQHYNVLFISGSIYNALPNPDQLVESIEMLR